MAGLRLLLLIGAVGVLLLTSRASGSSLRVQVYDVELTPELTLTPVDPVALDALVYVNREAAAQVAQIGLVADPARRAKIARSAAVWMTRAASDLPPSTPLPFAPLGTVVRAGQAEPYRTRQRAILSDWKQALDGYGAGRPGSLGQIRAVSQANAVLYADMLWHRAKAQEATDRRFADVD